MIAIGSRSYTVDDYHQMIEMGLLAPDDRVELLNHHIVPMVPQNPPHAATTKHNDRYLQRRLDGYADVRMQLPITLSTSEPEPDIAVVRLDDDDYADRHPTVEDIFLLIEIADTTLAFDRGEKAMIYAQAGIADYWVLAVKLRQAYIFRQPGENGYQSELMLTPDTTLSPLAFPTLDIPLTELFLPL